MAQAGAGESHSPLAQFMIQKIIPLKFGGVDVSFTNSSLAMVAAVVLVSFFLVFSMRRGALVPGRWQIVAEMSYEFIANMIRDNVGQEGRRYFPFIFTLFMFVFAGNLIGMIPYSFTFTSHLAVTFGLAIVASIGAALELSTIFEANHIQTRRWLTASAAVLGLGLSYSIPMSTGAVTAIAVVSTGMVIAFSASFSGSP